VILVLEVGRRQLNFPSRGRSPSPGATRITVSRGRHFGLCEASSGTTDEPIEWQAESLTNCRLDPSELRRRLPARKSNPSPTSKVLLQSLCRCISLAASKKSLGGLVKLVDNGVRATAGDTDEVPGS